MILTWISIKNHFQKWLPKSQTQHNWQPWSWSPAAGKLQAPARFPTSSATTSTPSAPRSMRPSSTRRQLLLRRRRPPPLLHLPILLLRCMKVSGPSPDVSAASRASLRRCHQRLLAGRCARPLGAGTSLSAIRVDLHPRHSRRSLFSVRLLWHYD